MSLEIRPTDNEIKAAKKLAEEVINRCQEEMPKEEDVRVGIGWTEEDLTKEQMGGTGAEETMDSQNIVVKFNTEIDNWKENLRRTIAHEYAHTKYWEEGLKMDYKWQSVIFEAHGMMFAEKMYPNTEAPWAEKFTREEISERWEDAKEELKTEEDWGSLWYGSEKWPQWFGYTLAYFIGKELSDDYSLSELLHLDEEDIIAAGERLFG